MTVLSSLEVKGCIREHFPVWEISGGNVDCVNRRRKNALLPYVNKIDRMSSAERDPEHRGLMFHTCQSKAWWRCTAWGGGELLPSVSFTPLCLSAFFILPSFAFSSWPPHTFTSPVVSGFLWGSYLLLPVAFTPWYTTCYSNSCNRSVIILLMFIALSIFFPPEQMQNERKPECH